MDIIGWDLATCLSVSAIASTILLFAATGVIVNRRALPPQPLFWYVIRVMIYGSLIASVTSFLVGLLAYQSDTGSQYAVGGLVIITVISGIQWLFALCLLGLLYEAAAIAWVFHTLPTRKD